MGDVPAALDSTNPTEWNALLRLESEVVRGHQATQRVGNSSDTDDEHKHCLNVDDGEDARDDGENTEDREQRQAARPVPQRPIRLRIDARRPGIFRALSRVHLLTRFVTHAPRSTNHRLT